jgi:SAM-dependent methyltransferase
MIDYSNAGERVVPLHKDWNFYSHLSVYQLAVPYLKGRVLDAGCGAGYGTAHLLHKGIWHAIGIDHSELAVAFCNDHFKIDRLEFHVVDMEEPLRLPDDSFDAIFSSNAMEHVARIDQLLKECARVLKQNGVMFMAVPAIVTPQSRADNIRNRFHLTNLTPLEWWTKIKRFFADVRPFSHWPTSEFAGWDNIRKALGDAPERTLIRESDFVLREVPIADLNVLEDNLNAVFVATKPR